MFNEDLAQDYIKRCEIRLKAIQVLYDCKSWADVMRECQEVVELALKALLRSCGIEFPRTHDVSKILMLEKDRLPSTLKKSDIDKMAEISKQLRKDREIAFYGSEDLTPSDFYEQKDAKEAMEQARFVVDRIKPHVR